MWRVEKHSILASILCILASSVYGQFKYSPNEALPNGQIVHYTDFSLCFADRHKQPYWVTYRLTQEALMVKRPRRNYFKADRNIVNGSASLNDYKHSGYDRGHILRASFCKTTLQSYKETYLMSNMSPQRGDVNRSGKVWYKVEDAEMYFTYALDSLYGTSGPIFKNNIGTIGVNEVTIPGYFYKVMYSRSHEKAIGFLIPHAPTIRNIFEFAVTIDKVEEETGIDFFHQLPAEKEAQIESQLDIEFWRTCYDAGKEEKKNPESFKANSIIEAARIKENVSNPIKVISWNVESGGADKDRIAATFQEITGQYGSIDIWGFSEVRNEDWIRTFREELGEDYWYQLGTTGRSDKLAIVYNRERFKQVGEMMELDDINPGGRVRSPLLIRLRENETDQEFLFMVNHLYRGSEDGRREQAQKLNTWVQNIDMPCIVVGDFNFDYDIVSEEGNRSYDLFVEDDHFIWVKPEELIKTHCSTTYNSVLDFIFVNDGALIWEEATSEIIVRDGDCDEPKHPEIPDHRPVFAEFK